MVAMSDVELPPTEAPAPQPIAKQKRKQRCQVCQYFDQESHFLQDDQIGSCRRHAPRPVVEEDEPVAQWPLVFLDDWCGEFA